MRNIFFIVLFLLFFIQPCYAIKIGLETDANRVYIGASTEAEIIDCNTNKLLFVMDKMKGYEFKAHRDYIAIKVDGEFKKIPSDKRVYPKYTIIPTHTGDNDEYIVINDKDRIRNNSTEDIPIMGLLRPKEVDIDGE